MEIGRIECENENGWLSKIIRWNVNSRGIDTLSIVEDHVSVNNNKLYIYIYDTLDSISLDLINIWDEES